MAVKKGLAGGWIANIDAEWFYKYCDADPLVGNPRKNSSTDVAKSDYVPSLLGQGAYDDQIPSNYSGYILFLSEPEIPIWCDLTAEEAADLYYAHYTTNYTTNLSGGSSSSEKFVVGGLMTQDGDSASYQWIEDFIARCKDTNGKVAYDLPTTWAFHVYGWGYDRVSEGDNSFIDQLNNLVAYQELLKDEYGYEVPIWITETGNQIGYPNHFRDQLLTWDAISWVERFAAFPGYEISDTPYIAQDVGYTDLWGKLWTKNNDIITVNGSTDTYTAPVPMFSTLQVNQHVWFAGLVSEVNNGSHWIKAVDGSAYWIQVYDDLVTQVGGGSGIYMHVGGWSLNMRLWDSTDDEITPMGQIFKDFTEDTSMIHMFDEAKIVLNGVTVYNSAGWQTEDLTDHSVPANATAVFVRGGGIPQGEGTSYFLSFGSANNNDEIDLIVRNVVHDSVYTDVAGIVRLDGEGNVYYKAHGANCTWSYLVILGYVL